MSYQAKRRKAEKRLVWNDGVGFLEIEKKPLPYNRVYFEALQRIEDSWTGRAVNKHRIKIVKKAVSFRRKPTYCLDVGCGTGYFIKELNRLSNIHCEGIDINPESIKWLMDNKKQASRERYHILTFWDSFQDIQNPDELLINYQPNFIAMCIPIFRNKEHAIRSDHFHPFEHHWYFTKYGLIEWMRQRKYTVLIANNYEDSKCGRREIQSFVFSRLST